MAGSELSDKGDTVRFESAPPQGRVLSFFLFVFGGIWLYPTLFPTGAFVFDLDRGAQFALLFCAVCWALAVVCWFWQAFLAIVEIDDGGMTITGHGVFRHFDDRRLLWEDIKAFEATPYGVRAAKANKVLRVIIHPQPGRASDYPLVLRGLKGNVSSSDIVKAAEERFAKAGYRLSHPWVEPVITSFREELLRD